jgi:uncharacterized membrane protein YidH (DUF202 family)
MTIALIQIIGVVLILTAIGMSFPAILRQGRKDPKTRPQVPRMFWAFIGLGALLEVVGLVLLLTRANRPSNQT